jgi:hypothetical protein
VMPDVSQTTKTGSFNVDEIRRPACHRRTGFVGDKIAVPRVTSAQSAPVTQGPAVTFDRILRADQEPITG